ncbi:A-kinase anchor protein SPHKAP isoform X1 [Cyprinus carpio]|uniref:A-kinase anchor protein SPHKAP isoform X1 n=2 Tax=Cyprinus carpio TaxID=7962 RepID=A0A9Q9XD35_CYPCA|nr:A-kinase anchor protein SPHKAP isoform X1 [Cyprinus carpio]XP_042599420.1 A-kinase anchor protein SPHKAP isoform X1 [Cyprinus carpio]
MLANLLTVLRNFTESNFQSSAMFEGSESTDTREVKSESTLGSSVNACRKVLCSNSVLDSSEYWLKNDKALCRIGFLEDQHDGGCPTICFVNLDRHTAERHDDSYVKKLASVCPELPRLIESLGVRQPKENEILLLSSLESPDSCQHDPSHPQRQKTADVCLVHCSCGRRPTQTNSVIFEINKFLIGLQSGQERQRHGRLAGQRAAEDDTNRSVSSIEEDFLTASEQLGEDSEDDPFRNDSEISITPESVKVLRAAHAQRKSEVEREDSEDSETLCTSSNSQKLSRTYSAPSRGPPATPKKVSRHTSESAGHYATNLAESVLQDAFIHLSQDEPSFVTEAAVSVSTTSQHSSDISHSSEEPLRARACSFELPKIVIVQSPDNSEEVTEWPEARSHGTSVHDSGNRTKTMHNSAIGHVAKPVEIALACAASVIGTITTPQVTEQLTLESGEEDECEDEEKETETEQGEYSFSSAVCGMSQVAGAVAAVDLADDSGDSDDSTDIYSASIGLLSVAQASTAVPLHCSIAEGTSVEAFRANVAEVLLREASAVLTHRQSYSSIANFLETTHNKIVNGITNPRRPYQEQQDLDNFTQEISDNIFQYALEKAEKRKELEGPGKDAPNIEGFLLDCVNNLLFDILCVTSRKISDISNYNMGSCDRQEGSISFREYEADTKSGREALSQLQHLIEPSQTYNNGERRSSVEKLSAIIGKREREQKQVQEEREIEPKLKEPYRLTLNRVTATMVKDQSDMGRSDKNADSVLPSAESSPLHMPRGRAGGESETRQQSLSSSSGALVALKMDSCESKTPVTCFADDLATTVVSMATELAAICLENSSGKQPWFCALKGGSEGPEGLLLPCRTAAVLRRKETQNGTAVTKKHRPPRLSEIKRKTEEQPELMERLVNRVVDETINLDEPTTSDPFALFASEVTARIMNCPELSVVDTSKSGQSARSRLQCERWSSRGKASSYESIPEEDADPSGTANTLGPGNRLGHNLSRGSSISKQSSCESITDEFSRFMVNQMETEGRGFDLLLDYYAGKNASSILAAAVQQAASKKNGHLNVRTSSCLSKQSSTESITEEFYRFMLKDMDKENKDYSLTKTKEWSNSLLPPSPRTPFCIRQSSVPDRRSSDSRLTVNSPIKANSFDGFARNVHGDSLNIYPTNSVSSMGLCKSDSCLYKRGQTDQITDMLIHETWASSIESLMRKNKIIAEPSEDSVELDSADSQPHVQLFANRLAADIVESGKSLLGCQQDGIVAACRPQVTVGERRHGFKHSRRENSGNRPSVEHQENCGSSHSSSCVSQAWRGQREVPLIHIEPDQREETSEDRGRVWPHHTDASHQIQPQSGKESETATKSSSDKDRASSVATAPSAGVEVERRSLSASSEESGSGSWAQIAPEDDPQEETTSSFIQLSEGNGNSSASSLGFADLEGFLDYSISSNLISEDRERKASHCQDQTDEVTSGLSTAGSSCQRDLLVLNFDMDSECVDGELRATLQWIAASELGVPALYFRRTQEHNLAKFHRVVQLAGQKAWRVGDLFSAVAQFCQLHQDLEHRGRPVPSLFDWILKTKR